jgi:hypothetical protein
MAIKATHPDYDAAALAWAHAQRRAGSTLNSRSTPLRDHRRHGRRVLVCGVRAGSDKQVLAVLTNFIPVLHTNVAQVPVTNLVARPEALAAIGATGSVVNPFAPSIGIEQLSDNSAARLTAQEISNRLPQA